MYNPDVFRQDDVAVLRQWIGAYPFGLLVTAADGAIEATHLPFVATEPDAQGRWRLIGHMAAANRQWRSFDGRTQALVVFSGPHAYVSPTLYPAGDGGMPVWHYSGIGSADRRAEPALPTWNYVAVHVRGVPAVLPDKGAALAAQVRAHEPAWTAASLPPDFVAAKQARITAFEVAVRSVEGKAKLGQRQAPDERAGVAQALARSTGSGEREIAAMMEALRPDETGRAR